MAAFWAVTQMFSVQKLIWVAVAIYLVWMLFKWFDRKKAAQNSAQQDKHHPAQSASVDVQECPDCKEFVSSTGCKRKNCVMRQN